MAQSYIELDSGMIIKTDTPQYWREGKKLSRKEGEARRRDYARAQLLEILKPGDTVHTVLRHVSKSGMARRISLFAIVDGEPRTLDGYARDLVGDRKETDGSGIYVGGCGMDMGFELVYRLGRALWPDGFACAGKNCRSNDHSNGDRDRTPHHHSDAGYALSHRWL